MSTIGRLSSLLGAVALAAALTPSAPAAAWSHGADAATLQKAPTVDGDTVTVETYLADGKTLVSTNTYGAETKGIPLIESPTPEGVSPLASGDGGSSSASGCNRVTVNNEGVSPNFGWHIYWYRTWTHWCWNRSTQNISDVQTGWSIDDVASFTFWKGENNNELGFYDYSTNDGHPRSAYKHYRQGAFDNCPVKFGCVETLYPGNTLRTYYNGTWAWNTSG
jgi:hypothetical protein